VTSFVLLVPQISYPQINNFTVTFNNFTAKFHLTCSLNVIIPSTLKVTWLYNDRISHFQVVKTGSTATLLIENLQPSDAGVYQCVFTDPKGRWVLRRYIILSEYICNKCY